MLLYDAPFASPRRVRIFLAEKGLKIATRPMDLAAGEHLREEYLAKNPRGTVPMLELEDGTCIWDSLAICEYLEKLHPERPMFGQSALEHAKVVMWFQRIQAEGFDAVAEAFRNTSPFFVNHALPSAVPTAQVPQLAERGQKRLEHFHRAMNGRVERSEFVAGGFYSFADIDLLCVLDFATRRAKQPIPADCKALAAWYERVSARPSATA